MLRKATVLVLALLLIPAAASAEVTREQLEQAQAKVREVSARLESELGELDSAIGLQTSYDNRISALENQLQDRQREIVLVRLSARERARAMYMNAGHGRFHGVLAVNDISLVGARTAYLDTLVDQDLDVVNQLEFLQNDASRLQDDLDELLALQEEEVGRLEASASGIYAQLEEANDEYQAVYQQWQKQEEERRRREEEERQRQEAAAAAAAAASSGYSSSGGTPSAGRTCPVAGAHSFRNSWGESRPGGRAHHGVDMIAARGTPLVAIETGYILSMSWHYAGGNGIYLKGNSGDVYYYAHLSGYASGMKSGLRVNKGQTIGLVGDTGNARGTPHLHLGYRPGGGPLTNPYQLMVKLCR